MFYSLTLSCRWTSSFLLLKCCWQRCCGSSAQLFLDGLSNQMNPWCLKFEGESSNLLLFFFLPACVGPHRQRNKTHGSPLELTLVFQPIRLMSEEVNLCLFKCETTCWSDISLSQQTHSCQVLEVPKDLFILKSRANNSWRGLKTKLRPEKLLDESLLCEVMDQLEEIKTTLLVPVVSQMSVKSDTKLFIVLRYQDKTCDK